MIGRKQRANSKNRTLRLRGYGVAATLLVAFFCVPMWVNAGATWPNDATNLPTQYSGSIPALNFLTPGTNDQQKLGSLIIGLDGSGSSLCLNSDPKKGTSDATNCITSWNQLRPTTTLALPLGAAPVGGTAPTDYLTSTGFIHLWGNNQVVAGSDGGVRYTFISEANPSSSSPSIGLVAADHHLIAADTFPSDNSNYAGYFLGKTVVGNASPDAAFCLNDTFPHTSLVQTGCIQKWTDIMYPNNGIGNVTLFPANTEQTPQDGQISLAGSAQFGGLIAGSTSGLPAALTCGDGICQTGEAAATCPIDCATAMPAMTVFSVWPGNGKVYFDAKTPYQYVAGMSDMNILVIKKAGSAPTAVPQDGVYYQAGQTIGDATVVYATTVNNPLPAGMTFLSGTPDTATNGVKTYYAAYAANSYPRYSQRILAATTPNSQTAQVTIVMNPLKAGTVTSSLNGSSSTAEPTHPAHGEGPALNCGVMGSAVCSGTFTVGTGLHIGANDVLVGYAFSTMSGGTGCNTNSSDCEFVVTGDTTITVKYTRTRFNKGGL